MRITDDYEHRSGPTNGHVQPLLAGHEAESELTVLLDQPFVAAHRRNDDDITLLSLELFDGTHLWQVQLQVAELLSYFNHLNHTENGELGKPVTRLYDNYHVHRMEHMYEVW